MRDLPRLSRPSYRAHLLAAALDGVFSGVIQLAPFVASRTLEGSRLAIMCYVMASSLAMFASPAWAVRLAGVAPRTVFLSTGVAGRLTLLATAALGTPVPFLAVCALNAIAHAAVLPTLNALWQANYPVALRGRVLGRVTVVQGAATILTALGAGAVLHAAPEWYRLLFPAAGVCGFAAFAAYASIRVRHRVHVPHPAPAAGEAGAAPLAWIVPRPWRQAWRLVWAHPAFALYEVGFMIYGFGFFFAQPFLADFCARDLRLDYDVYSRGVALQEVTKIATSPLFGRLLDSLRAPRTAALAFATLPCFALAFAYAEGPGVAYLGFAIFGVGMAGVNVCWTLGTVEFAGREDAAPFMGVHAACVGFRSLVAPLLAYGLQAAADDVRLAFLVAAGFFAVSVVVMSGLARRWPGPPGPAPDAAPAAKAAVPLPLTSPSGPSGPP